MDKEMDRKMKWWKIIVIPNKWHVCGLCLDNYILLS